MILRFLTACLMVTLCAPAAPAQKAAARLAPLDTLVFSALHARSIGPAVMGGRVSDIALDPRDAHTFYVGLATGGVMKTADNGHTFAGIFEHQATASVGALAVGSDSGKTVWVGTGEANDRNSSGFGTGVYVAGDCTGKFRNVGLKNSRAIARIVLHPANPRTAYVAAVGDLWQSGKERGLYKTTDGGATWTKVLSAAAPYDDRVGAGDVAIDPSNPNILYATLYARRRTPWSFTAGPAVTDGKDVGGIFKSVDAGATWQKLTNGLPGQTRRIGLAVYAKNPRVVYAVVESELGGTSNIDDVQSRAGGVFRSDDAGETWTRMSSLNPRPFYFSQIRIDPQSDNKIYVLGFALHVSEDGGRTWREDRFTNVHPDNHALVIDPRDSKRLLIGNDGGVYQSYDGGAGWAHLNRIAAGQFYRISVDSMRPYRICGGLQDNQNWVGPSDTRSNAGIVNEDWINIEGGDGFYCAFTADPNVVFAESQGGSIYRFNLKSGDIKSVRPAPPEGAAGFRFQWDAPLIASAHEPGVLYLAGNRVFKLTGNGERWQSISNDLSTQERDRILTTGSGAETYGVVYSLAESPLTKGVLWAGTDDGKIWLTRDGGASWTDLSASLPPAAKGQWIARIEPGHADANVAYMTVEAYRTGNYAPLVYRTADGGRTWAPIAANLPAEEPAHVIREDPRNVNVLYVGTETSLWASTDRGAHWQRLGGMPTVPVHDIIVHPRDNDLVIATHGKSVFIVDDISPLQSLTPEFAAAAAHLFPIRPAFGFNRLPGSASWNGNAVFRGENPPLGAIINFYVKQWTGQNVSIKITDAADRPIANLSAPGVPGLARVVWDLKPSADVLNSYGGEGRKFVRSGDYTVTLAYGDITEKQKVHVEIAPGLETR